MTMINLRDVYPFYHSDLLVEVPDEVALLMIETRRQEKNARRRMYRHKAQYSLDREDGIEHRSLSFAPSPAELYEQKLEVEELYAALAALPPKQSRRVYAHYILGVSKADIARAEGVAESAIRDSICRGLKLLRDIMKKSF